MDILCSELLKPDGDRTELHFRSITRPPIRDALASLVDGQDRRDIRNLRPCGESFESRIRDEALDLVDLRQTHAMVDAAGDELHIGMGVDVDLLCRFPDAGKQVGRALVLDAAESFLPLGD
ncbi:hypothetical protein GGQ10_002108 [Salinibacter ruber]|uniref:hypothetical protein n=1 Tax=Salinibacter ruber TaxID=146919 RepID=UPI002167824F|nr:hypothetical protein [Salinibacter ruber]MCS4087282.1 hypothetical protein [Salinibacter ruber]